MADSRDDNAGLDNATDNIFRRALMAYFYAATVGAILHLLWFFVLPRLGRMEGLTQTQWDYVNLLNLSIFLMMLFFMAMAARVVFGGPFSPSHTRFICDLLAAFWTGRLILEIALPIQVPLLYTTRTSALLKIFCVTLVAVLLSPEIKLQLYKWRHPSTSRHRRFTREVLGKGQTFEVDQRPGQPHIPS